VVTIHDGLQSVFAGSEWQAPGHPHLCCEFIILALVKTG